MKEFCEFCKSYSKINEFTGECFKINSHVMVINEIPEADDYASQNKLTVRKEFGCVMFEKQ